jgi:hypothetical protein
MRSKGLCDRPREVMDLLNRGDNVDPATYYFRATRYFETSFAKYGWMNRICSIAGTFVTEIQVGSRTWPLTLFKIVRQPG